MSTLCLKFPNIATAHARLYGPGNVPKYANIYDNDQQGIRTQRVVDEDGRDRLVLPDDGSYYADIAGLNSVPSELAPYVIEPERQYRKHEFSGE